MLRRGIKPLIVADGKLQVVGEFANGGVVYAPWYSLKELVSGDKISGSATRVATEMGGGISSAHVGYGQVPPRVKTAQTGTVLVVYRPYNMWGSTAFCFETMYTYATRNVQYYSELCYMHGGNRYELSGAGSGLSVNATIVCAFAHTGTEYRSAWRVVGGKAGFKVTAGSEWFGDNSWSNNTADVVGINAFYTSGSAQGSDGVLVLFGYLPGVAMTDDCLVMLRDNPMSIFAP